MKKIFPDNNSVIYFLLAIAVTIIGIEIGSLIYNFKSVDTVIRGIVGIMALSLMYFVFISPAGPYAKHSSSEKNKFSGHLKNIILYFFLSIVAYWALQYVAIAIFYLIELTSAN